MFKHSNRNNMVKLFVYIAVIAQAELNPAGLCIAPVPVSLALSRRSALRLRRRSALPRTSQNCPSHSQYQEPVVQIEAQSCDRLDQVWLLEPHIGWLRFPVATTIRHRVVQHGLERSLPRS